MRNAEHAIHDETHTINPHEWVANYADYLYAFAFNRLDDQEQARDVVQETFLSALERIDKYEGRSSEKTWLTSIIKYKIFDIYRARSLTTQHINFSRNNQAQNVFRVEDGHWKEECKPREFAVKDQDLLEKREFYLILKKCMKKLPSIWLAVFTLKFMEDLTSEIICDRLEITRANYWVIIHRSKVSLRACLQKNWL